MNIIMLAAAAAMLAAPVAARAEGVLDIPQVSARAEPSKKTDAKESAIESDEPAADYQSSVMSNAIISDYGRVQAFTGGQPDAPGNSASVIQGARDESQLGGNTAIIRQQGAYNDSVVVQKGGKNTAKHYQNGEFNELYLNQQGEGNFSLEVQEGAHNRKTKVQDSKAGITIEQVE